MTDADRSPTRRRRAGRAGLRARLVRTLRTSRAASIVRRAAARGDALRLRLTASDRSAPRLRDRATLALRATRARRDAIAAVEALRVEARATELGGLPRG